MRSRVFEGLQQHCALGNWTIALRKTDREKEDI